MLEQAHREFFNYNNGGISVVGKQFINFCILVGAVEINMKPIEAVSIISLHWEKLSYFKKLITYYWWYAINVYSWNFSHCIL